MPRFAGSGNETTGTDGTDGLRDHGHEATSRVPEPIRGGTAQATGGAQSDWI